MTTKSDDYFRTFCTIIKSIQNTSQKQEILDLIVESAVEEMDAKACSLFLIRSRRDRDGLFYPAAQVGLSDNYIHTGPAKGRDVTQDILKKGGYLMAKDATTDPRLENHEQKKQEGIASLLVVPVIAEKDPIGILALYTAERRDFSELDVAFLRALADYGGIAIVRAHQSYRQERELKLLTRVSEHLSSSIEIKEVLLLMTEEIAKTLDLLGVTIRLYESGSNQLRLVASHGLSKKYLSKGPVSSKRIKTVIKNQCEIIDDVASYDIDYKKERQEEGIITMLHLPITVKGAVIGVMGLYSNEKRVVEDDDLTLLTSIARQCGLAIQNASLYLQIKAEKKDLEEEIWIHRSWF